MAGSGQTEREPGKARTGEAALPEMKKKGKSWMHKIRVMGYNTI